MVWVSTATRRSARPAVSSSHSRTGPETSAGSFAVRDDGLRDHETLGLPVSPLASSMAPKCAVSSARCRGRDPGQHDAQGRAPFLGVLQQLPDRRVGVPAGRGHEQPQVRGVQELVRELPVRLHHRVDVRRVEQGHALGHALAGGQHQQAVTARHGQPFLADPGQRRQEHVLGEPVRVVGMAGQHRAVRGRPPDPGRADLGADDAVHQRRLARPGRPDQGDQDRRARTAGAGAAGSRRSG